MYGRIELNMCYMLPSFLATFNSFGHVETDFLFDRFEVAEEQLVASAVNCCVRFSPLKQKPE